MSLKDHELMRLEQMIDENGLESVLDGLSDVCSTKAAHVADNWQDKRLAEAWDDLAESIGRASCAASERGL